MSDVEIIRIFHGCEVRTEKSHFEGHCSASRVSPNGTDISVRTETAKVDSFSCIPVLSNIKCVLVSERIIYNFAVKSRILTFS